MTTAATLDAPAVTPAPLHTHESIRQGYERYRVSSDQYRAFRRDGFLAVRGLVQGEDITQLREHTEQLMRGELPEQQDAEVNDGSSRGADSRGEEGTTRHLTRPPDHLSDAEKAQYFLRIHMLHRQLPLHERYLLHPRVLDVLEVLIGPDVLALQTMLFLKPPGKPGQGWHQDTYYIPTHPDTLCGAWIAIDDADERNGAIWFAKGSGVEPVHPPCPESGYGFGDKMVGDVKWVKGVSNPDDSDNDLTAHAAAYDHTLCSVKAGDVVFFNGHVLHRSKENWTTDRFRRAFVSHYCNARSFTQWGADVEANDDPNTAPTIDPVTKMTNASHILARGDSHLPFAQPRFETPCAALLAEEDRRAAIDQAAQLIAETNHGLMGCAISDPHAEHDHK